MSTARANKIEARHATAADGVFLDAGALAIVLAPEPALPARAEPTVDHFHHARTVRWWEAAAVAVGILGLHVGIARAIPRGQEAVVHPPSKVEIQFTRPYKPPVVPPQELKPEPPKPKPKAKEPPPAAKETPPPPPEAPVPEAEPEAAAPAGPDGTTVATEAAPLGLGTGAGTAPTPPAPPAPAPIKAAHEGANYLKNPRPAYPPLALSRGWEGRVQLKVYVGPQGRPLNIVIAQTSGRDMLDNAAINAVRGWSFVPAKQGDTAVAGWVVVPIVFQIR
ncbi:MAG: energy transducer TonB [Deltaproteobacteria bacterium]|nr:energy transducer TonB [Deltaproteobacteria bacterium]